MRVLFLGDVVGSCGRGAVQSLMREVRHEQHLDYVVVNGENSAGGRGITPKIADAFLSWGVDVVSGGNHTFQQRDVYPYLDGDRPVLRPLNYPPGVPGTGIATVGRLTVINAIGRTFMGQAYEDPFRAIDAALATVPPGQFVLVDFHAEATSEKQALGWYLDGRVTGVVGTHTHVPTADARLLHQGTAYCTDAGMCGARDSVIGDEVEAVIRRFLTQMPTRLAPAEGVAVVNGLIIEADDTSINEDGPLRAVSIERFDREIG